MDIKTKQKSLLRSVKSLEENRSKCTSISSLFTENLTALRRKIIHISESILLEDFESIGKKAREILWRKVFYDSISTSKTILRKSGTNLTSEDRHLLYTFIESAIHQYKLLILKFDDIFNLDLRNSIDFNIVTSGADTFERQISKEIYTVNETCHALENIHSFLINLGDLNRYLADFGFDEEKDYRGLAFKFYSVAFKLDPKNGMPHNQLGTLFDGNNFQIDSIFHYLYSLCLPKPAELSEGNVSKIFQQNILLIESTPKTSGFNIREFMQQVILVIDIFFYDKDIEEFNALCYSVLMEFKEYLNNRQRNSREDQTFQLTSIFMLCFLKLKKGNSPKVHSLNAFLIAFCAEIVNRTIETLIEYISDHKSEELDFIKTYNHKFQVQESQSYLSEKGSGMEKNGSGSSSKETTHMLFSELDPLSLSGQVRIFKRHTPVIQQDSTKKSERNKNSNRRRRKRISISVSTSSSPESDSESLLNDDISLKSDFDSCDEDDNILDMRFSSDESVECNNDDFPLTPNDGEDVIIENEEIVYGKKSQDNFIDKVNEDTTKYHKAKEKKKYSKINPNLILKFCEKYSSWMKSLKVLFDWLRVNTEIILDCYKSNPEFVQQIIKLINFINIDIFTRNFFFNHSMITLEYIREDLRSLFDARQQIATVEDIVFKKFPLFDELQQPIDWDLNNKLQITSNEDLILRTFKIVDFGFFISKQKTINYKFCTRSRIFIEERQRRKKSEKDEKKIAKKSDRIRNKNKRKVEDCEQQFERLSIKTYSQETRNEELPLLQTSSCKSYLRNNEATKEEKSSEDRSEIMGKMGKLWLKNEVKNLESRSKSINFTPFLMVDTSALIYYLQIVKNIVKTREFVVLIPKAVLQDIDGLKKDKEEARNVIKWLEVEFQKGNRFLRTQRENESLPLPLLKIPPKLEREDTVFINIVPFANFIVTNNISGDFPVLTFLTGENLDTKKSIGLNQGGILQTIPVKYEPITRFYSNYKK